jgi:hypothetical protein
VSRKKLIKDKRKKRSFFLESLIRKKKREPMSSIEKGKEEKKYVGGVAVQVLWWGVEGNDLRFGVVMVTTWLLDWMRPGAVRHLTKGIPADISGFREKKNRERQLTAHTCEK